jgi:hypothetical protein
MLIIIHNDKVLLVLFNVIPLGEGK